MNKTKSLLAIALVIAMLVCLSACSKHEPVSAETFQSTMEESGFAVQDDTASYDGGENTNGVYIALNDEALQIELYLFKEETNASSAFNNSKAAFENEASGTTSSSSVTSPHYDWYKANTSDTAFIIARVDNTLLYCKTANANGDKATELFKTLGYK